MNENNNNENNNDLNIVIKIYNEIINILNNNKDNKDNTHNNNTEKEEIFEYYLNIISNNENIQNLLGQNNYNLCYNLCSLLLLFKEKQEINEESKQENKEENKEVENNSETNNTTNNTTNNLTTQTTTQTTQTSTTNNNDNLILITFILKLICKLSRRKLLKNTSNYNNIKIFSDNNCCEMIIQIMKNNINYIPIIEAGCWCIMVLSSDNEDNQIKFANEGGCNVLLEILNNYATNIDIIEIICRALRNLSSNLSIAAYFIAEGICDPITGTIVIHTNNPIQLEAALWVVVNLSCQSENATVLGSSGICVAVTDILKVNLDNENVVNAACYAIRNLSCGSNFNYAQFSHTDICETLVTILKKYSQIQLDNYSYPSCIIPALWAVSNLTCDNEIGEQYGKILDGCSILVILLRNYLLQLFHFINSKNIDYQYLIEDYINLLEPLLWAIRNTVTGGITCHTQLIKEGLLDLLFLILESEWFIINYSQFIVLINGIIVNILSIEFETKILIPLFSQSIEIPKIEHITTNRLCELLFNILIKFKKNQQIQQFICHSFYLILILHPEYSTLFNQFNLSYHLITIFKLNNDSNELLKYIPEILYSLYYKNNDDLLTKIEEISNNIDIEKNEKDENGNVKLLGVIDKNTKRVVIRQSFDEMKQIWVSNLICNDLNWKEDELE